MCPTKTNLIKSKEEKGHTAVTVHGNEVFVDDELIEWLGEDFIVNSIPANLTERRRGYKADHIIIVTYKNARYELNNEGQLLLFPEKTIKFRFSWMKVHENGNISYIPFLTSPNLHY